MNQDQKLDRYLMIFLLFLSANLFQGSVKKKFFFFVGNLNFLYENFTWKWKKISNV